MSLKFLIVSFTFVLTLSHSTQAQTKEAPPTQMFYFLESIKKLQPYMISEEAFKNPSNEKTIQTELNKLKDAARGLTHEERISTPGIKDAALQVQSHLTELANSFPLSKTYSRYLLRATLDGCASCHAQVKGSDKPLFYFESKDLSGTDLQKAEFLFAIRQYPSALKSYEGVLSSSKIKEQQRTAIQRILAIQLRHHQDFGSSEKPLQAFIKSHPDNSDIAQPYLAAINNLKSKKIPLIDKDSVRDFEKFASDNCLPSSNYVQTLFASGLLHDYLDAQRKAHKKIDPAIFYWTGKCDSALQSSSIFTLTHIMFEHCVKAAGNSGLGKKCFQEIEDQILLDFTGSSGMHLPKDQSDKLNSLRKTAGLKIKNYQSMNSPED